MAFRTLFLVAIFMLSSTVVITDSQACQDRESVWTCYSWLLYRYCDNPEYRGSMYRLCRKTCGLCNIGRRRTTLPPTTKPTTLPPTTKPLRPEDCKDTNDYCLRYQSYGYCDDSNIYYQFMTQRCPKTCGFCKGVCKDENANCTRWSRYCVKTGQYWNFMRKNCAKTCNLCIDKNGGTQKKSKGKKEFECTFDKNLCHWTNEFHEDIADWTVGKDPDGPSGGGDGAGNYAYLDTKVNSYKGRLILPWILVLPLDEMKHKKMCFVFQYNIRDGVLKVLQQIIPSINDPSPPADTLLTLDKKDSIGWKEAEVTVTVDKMHTLLLEAVKTKLPSNVGIDNVRFYKGEC